MEEYIFILEQLEKLQIEEKLSNLSKKFADKKVVLFGANNALDAICSRYDLEKYFNIIGICDELFLKENIFQYKGFKVISILNLYFSGVDVIINLKDEFMPVEKNLRMNHLIKKRVKVVHLLEKSILKKSIDFYEKIKAAVNAYKYKHKFWSLLKDFASYNKDDLISKLNYQKKIDEISSDIEKPIRVLFMVQDYTAWSMQGLYNKMKKDKLFKMLPIVALPASLNSDAVTRPEAIKFFNDNGMECIDGYEYVTKEAVMLKALKPDIIFYQQPEFIKSDFSTQKLSQIALTCFVENEFALDNQSYFKSNFMQDRLNNTWKIFASHDFNLKSQKNIVTVGFTKFEEYKKDFGYEFENIWSKSDTIEKNRIVYVPSYSVNEKFNAGKLKEQQKFILDFAANHPQYSFVVIPHPKLKDKCLEKKIITQEEYDKYIFEWNELPNAFVADYFSSTVVFKTSDILITDSLNTASDYFPNAKPVIFLENNNKNILNILGEKIFKTFYKANSNEAIEIILEDILVSNNDYNAENRNLLISKYHNLFERESSDIIIDYIKNELRRIPTDN